MPRSSAARVYPEVQAAIDLLVRPGISQVPYLQIGAWPMERQIRMTR